LRSGLDTASRIAQGERIEDIGPRALANAEAMIDAVSRRTWFEQDHAPSITLGEGHSRSADEYWTTTVN
jgi:hypothetical protein